MSEEISIPEVLSNLKDDSNTRKIQMSAHGRDWDDVPINLEITFLSLTFMKFRFKPLQEDIENTEDTISYFKQKLKYQEDRLKHLTEIKE